MANSSPNDTKPTFPYTSFRTILTLIEDMEAADMPPRIDRSYLPGSEGSKTQVLQALKFFGLIGKDHGNVTERFIHLVKMPDERPAVIRSLLEAHYPAANNLGTVNATQAQLEETFAPLAGSTRRKAVAFYLKAAEYAGLALSPHFKAPRTGRPKGSKTRRKSLARTKPITPGSTPPSSTESELRTRYVEMLMKKAEADEGLNDDLLNRIEMLLGFGSVNGDDEQEESE